VKRTPTYMTIQNEWESAYMTMQNEWESGEENIAVHHQMVLIKLYRAPRADKL